MKQTIRRADIVCCSNGQKKEEEPMVQRLLDTYSICIQRKIMERTVLNHTFKPVLL